MIAVEVLSRLLKSLLNGCMGCFVSEHLSNIVNSFPVMMNVLQIRTTKALTPENEIFVVERFVYPVFHQHGQLIRGRHETDGLLSAEIVVFVLCHVCSLAHGFVSCPAVSPRKTSISSTVAGSSS